MSLTSLYIDSMRDAREGVPDHFVEANATGLHFPCSVCKWGEEPLPDGPCEGCCHFIH